MPCSPLLSSSSNHITEMLMVRILSLGARDVISRCWGCTSRVISLVEAEKGESHRDQDEEGAEHHAGGAITERALCGGGHFCGASHGLGDEAQKSQESHEERVHDGSLVG